MKRRLLVFLFCALPAFLHSETLSSEASQDNYPEFTVLGGAGNSMGWLGVQCEKFFYDGRTSLFAGLGHTVDTEESGGGTCDAPDGATWAAGGKFYSGGLKHRAFVEISYSQVACEWACQSDRVDDRKRFYGPGVQLGYQRVAAQGFTLMVSAGVGLYTDSESDSQAEILLGAGLGYTWR